MKLLTYNKLMLLVLVLGIGFSCTPEEVAPWAPRDLIINGESEPVEFTTETYNVALYEGATYSWTVPSGGTITEGAGTFAITVDWGAKGTVGDITVAASGVTVTQASFSIEVIEEE